MRKGVHVLDANQSTIFNQNSNQFANNFWYHIVYASGFVAKFAAEEKNEARTKFIIF